MKVQTTLLSMFSIKNCQIQTYSTSMKLGLDYWPYYVSFHGWTLHRRNKYLSKKCGWSKCTPRTGHTSQSTTFSNNPSTDERNQLNSDSTWINFRSFCTTVPMRRAFYFPISCNASTEIVTGRWFFHKKGMKWKANRGVAMLSRLKLWLCLSI